MILKMKTKQPSTISTGDIITISADGFCVRAGDDPKNSSPIGVARNASGTGGYATVDIGATGITVGQINNWNITYEPLPPFFCPKHGEIGENVVPIIDATGKRHYYCEKCALEKLGGTEAFRWEDKLTGRDFEEKETQNRQKVIGD